MKSEQLDGIMNWKQLQDYLIATPAVRLPTFKEAKKIKSASRTFWVSDKVEDRPAVFNKGKLAPSHPIFQWSVVTVNKAKGK